MTDSKKISGILTDAFSRIGNLQSSVGNKSEANVSQAKESASIFPQDIPYDELMQLSMKLNKRMQAMEAKGQELSRRLKSMTTDRRLLIEIISEISGSSFSFHDDESINIEAIRKSIDNFQIKAEIIPDNSTNETGSTTPDTTNLTGNTENILSNNQRSLEHEFQRCKTTESSLRSLIATLEREVEEKSAAVDALTRQLESEVQNHEDRLIHLQMQLTAFKHKDESREKELHDNRAAVEDLSSKLCASQSSLAAKDDMILFLQTAVSNLEASLQKTKEKVKETERNGMAGAVLKAEQEALVKSLRRDLKAALEAKDQLTDRAKVLSEQSSAGESAQQRLMDLQPVMSRLQTDLDEASAVITRLRAEAQSAEKNHAIRTAMLAAAESQIEDLNRSLAAKQRLCEDSIVREKMLEEQLATAEARFEARLQGELLQMKAENEGTKAEKAQLEATVTALKADHASALESTQREFARKSAAARSLVEERDKELVSLRAQVETLQAEIESGSHNERRIFELAQMQAHREATYGLHSDTRDIAFQQALTALSARDLSLARLQHEHSLLTQEATELRRVRKREGVNMDYLKNIVIQFMSFPGTAPERQSLVPVIAMLLQFTRDEVRIVESAVKSSSSSMSSVWATRSVKEVKVVSPRSSRSSPALVALSIPPRAVSTGDGGGGGGGGGSTSDLSAIGTVAGNVSRDSSVDEDEDDGQAAEAIRIAEKLFTSGATSGELAMDAYATASPQQRFYGYADSQTV